MLADFQQALADLTASPELCRAVLADAELLSGRYVLTSREQARVLAIVRHRGMAAACMVYRMNRIAPLVMNLRESMRALGPRLRETLSSYWRDYPHGYAHFLLEAERFGDWLSRRLPEVESVPGGALTMLLERELERVGSALVASQGTPPLSSADLRNFGEDGPILVQSPT